MLKFVKVFKSFFGSSKEGSFELDQTHPAYEVLVEALEMDDEEKFLQNLHRGTFVENWSAGHFTFEKDEYDDGRILYKGEPVDEKLNAKLMSMVRTLSLIHI